MNLTENDIRQIQDRQQTIEKVRGDVEKLIKGLVPARLFKAATIGDGIERMSVEKRSKYVSLYNATKDNFKVEKFIPASGEATRMFRFLFEFLDRYDPGSEQLEDFIDRPENFELKRFHEHKAQLPFFKSVIDKCREFMGASQPNDTEIDLKSFVHAMLDGDKLNLSHLPKGLIPFHSYPEGNRTPFEEHLFEAGIYAAADGKVNLHFTISEKHHDLFKGKYKQVQPVLSDKLQLEYKVTFSYQDKSTDTVALTPDNELFRNDDGSLLFRPSGHGALLHNLNSIDADLVFIKNIDNVVDQSYLKDLSVYKSLLAGYLIDIQKQAFKYLNSLDKGDAGTEINSDDILKFETDTFNIRCPEEYAQMSENEKNAWLFSQLNRPIRVCGMVKNEGQPGGGPFWTIDEKNQVSLQIIEASQVNKSDKEQLDIFNASTHFNPVDLVCGLKNFKGERFDLNKYCDHNAAFISEKTHMGRPLKALELPGLWNGGMAYWNTIFVEVPLETFNPVKTVNDLFKPMHQTG